MTTISQPIPGPSDNCTAATVCAIVFGILFGLLLLFCVVMFVLYIWTWCVSPEPSIAFCQQVDADFSPCSYRERRVAPPRPREEEMPLPGKF
jgi:hypothetical protein